MEESIEVNYDDNNQDHYDVIIIGGGLTGLTAGYYLLNKNVNLSLMIIESKDEIGGRCNNINNGFYGHTFQNNFINLLNNLNIPIIYGRKSEYKKLTLHLKNNKLVNDDDESSIISSQVRYFIKSLELSCKKKNFKEYTKDEYSKYLASLSVNDYINGTIFSSRARLICRSYISLICGISNLNNVSCLWLFVMLNNSGGFFKRLNYLFDNNTRFFIEGGIGQVINRLRNEILEKNGSINYSENVKKINQGVTM
ncbi:probable flavin-containing monoamine oxidase A isoform X2 [Microplitis mediator]|uniref:probable flavin-containing monoamine oxidase A isoform X2 n=1 Tax=Microplitis mediator TaxID=375433 RepID=UPI0025556E67|nr:probable flavin-containing monoamine oxidase A isoform X2 [Microplitis mediator]